MIRRKSSANTNCEAVSYKKCPAKTWQTNEGDICIGRKVLEHCVIVGKVAEKLIQLYPGELGKKLFPEGAPLIAAAHDLGKVSPTFFAKLYQACTKKPDDISFTMSCHPGLESEWGGHAGVSQVAARALDLPKFIPEILGQHHGFTPPVKGSRADDQKFGGPAWQQQRKNLANELAKRLGMSWPVVKSDVEARLIAGLTSVADWIGSGTRFENPHLPWQENIGTALSEAGWQTPLFKADLGFIDVFGFTPRPAQQQFIESVKGPGVYTLEAPMGIGKTEAALYAAYTELAAGQAWGIYFALPTQLTSNKIYDRFNSYLDAILHPDTPNHSLLLHSGAWLVETSFGEEGQPGRSWFSSAKRGLLAPFAVGTLDQALMAAMNVRHGFVRAFGLAGKVVILDEVHTYDAYTSTLLDALIDLLRQLQCTVIILSATLNHGRRCQLLQEELHNKAYPLITALPNSGSVTELPVMTETGDSTKNPTDCKVTTRIIGDTKPALEEALDRAGQGQQVLWLENTVAEAQQIYLTIAARAQETGVACGLLHSRFTPQDRTRHETRWVGLFGKSGWSERNRQGRILMGSQVLEQSLDIDADFLISRFAPTDMLLQRLGRLWRHLDTPRHSSAVRECWLLAPDIDHAIAAPYTAFGDSAAVYAPYILCRSLEVWHNLNTIDLPADIRPLIDATYDEREEIEAMIRWRDELENGTKRRKGRKTLAQLARVGLASGGKTLSDSQAQTRYSERDNVEVLLLKSINPLPKGGCELTLLDDTQHRIPKGKHMLEKPDWRRLSATLMQQVLTVSLHNAPLPVARNLLLNLGLGHCLYLGHPGDGDTMDSIRVALVTENDTLEGLYGRDIHPSKVLTYREDLGYRSFKQERIDNNGK